MIGQRLANRYEVTSELGRGGMGVVYRARDPRLDREVAVKMIEGGAASEVDERRFRREARMAAQLDHPGIVPIFDFGRHQDALFFVMPVLQGRTLDEWIADRSLVLGDVLEIGAQVAEALDYSNAEGVIHRDVKPENIMVQRSPEGLARAWVMDFGLALTQESHRITRSDRLPGTLAYLSPEHILSLDLDGRSDLYSLGTILYECLAGHPPFAGGAQGSVLYRIVHEAPAPLTATPSDRALDALVMACLAKDPLERPARGREVARRLRSILASLAMGERQRPVRVETASPGPGRVKESPMFGREEALASLRRRLETSRVGNCQLVLLAGEAGQGKSRLLRAVATLAADAPGQVLRGRFAGQEATFPHHGFCELVQDYFRSRPASGSAGQAVKTPAPSGLGALAAPLLALFPVLGEVRELREAVPWSARVEGGTASGMLDRSAEGSTAERARRETMAPARVRSVPANAPLAKTTLPETVPADASALAQVGDPTQVFELLARTLLCLGQEEPLVLLLENLHAAGASIDALEYITRRLGPTPTLIVATYRTDTVAPGHPIHRLRRDFEGDPCFETLVVEPLARSAHRQLVDHLLSEVGHGPDRVLAERLFEASDGNPFFTRELVRSLVEAREIGPGRQETLPASHDTGVLENLPETIQQVVEARLERLPEGLLQPLSLASVLGRHFDYRDLVVLWSGGEVLAERGEGETALEDQVDQLIREGFLEEDRLARGDVLRFTSGMVRDVLHRGLSRRRRRALHRRFANHLEKQHEGRLDRVYPQLVHHFSEGDEAIKTVSYALMLARRSVGAFSPLDTVRSARTALEFIEDDELEDTGEVEGELRLLLASALRLLGNVDSALREAGRSAKVFERSGEIAAAAGAAWLAAETAWQTRRLEETRQWLDRGIVLARRGGADRLGRLLTLAATVANLRGEGRRAATLLREAEELERGAGSGRTVETGETLRTVLPNPLTTFEPSNAFSVEDAEVLANVFETLVGSDIDGNLVPRLGVEWSITDEGRGLRVRLRSGVRFSDGTPCDATAVRTALSEAARRPTRDPAAAWSVLEGLDAWCEGRADTLRGIQVDDPRTLTFRLQRPLPIFASLLTDLRTAVAFPELGGKLVGTGPFQIESAQVEAPVLVRNPRWRGEPAACERLELDSRLDSVAVADALRRGDLDLGRDLPPVVLEDLLRDPEMRQGLVEAPKKNTYFALFNHRGPSTCSPLLRQVLATTVRPQDLVWRTLGRLAQPASCLVPPGVLGHDPGRRGEFLTVDAARQLLDSVAEAEGAADGPRGLAPLRVVVHPAFRERFASLERALFAAWERLGLTFEVVGTTIEDQIHARRDGADVDVLLTRWAPDYEDPDNVLRGMFHSAAGAYRAYYSDPELDTLLDTARGAEGATLRRRGYQRIEGRLMADHAVLPLFHEVDYRLAAPRIRGVRHLGSPPYVAYAEITKGSAPRRASRGLVTAPPLRVPVASQLDRLEPELALLAEPGEVMPNLYETLTRVDAGAHIVPHLAEEIRLENGDHRVWLRLRRGVRFHDGRLLGPRDVRFSFERLLRSPYPGVASILWPIRGARAFQRGEASELVGLQLEGSHGIRLELDEPLPLFPAMLSNPMVGIVPEGTTDFTGHWRQGTVGSGPYRVVHFEAGRRLELEAHPEYWGTPPRGRRLVFELGVSSEAMLSGMRDGRWSLATALRPTDVEGLRQEPRFAAGLREGPTLSTFFLVLNAQDGPFADRSLRQALRARLDVGSLLRATLGRLALPASGVLAAGLTGHEGDDPGEARTTATASSLAGTVVRASIHPVFRGQYAFFWQRLLGALHRLEVEVETQRDSLEQALQQVAQGSVDLVVARRLAAYPDPDAFVRVFHSRDGLFGRLIGDLDLDRLIERGRQEPEPSLRHAIYRDVERWLEREALIVPLFDEQLYCLSQPEVAGLRLRLGWPRVAFEALEWRSTGRS